MDYQGNYFPEDRDENESKIYKTVKNIFKWTMYGISFFIYALLFYLLIFNRDSKILEKNYMNMVPELQSVDTDDMLLYHINTRVFMNEDGSLQVHNVEYSDDYKILEIGIKFNANKLTNGIKEDAVEYILTDSNGNRYNVVNVVDDSKGRYGFLRVCFDGIDIDLDSNDIRREFKPSDSPITNTAYFLEVFDKASTNSIFKFTIYDNSTTFTEAEFED